MSIINYQLSHISIGYSRHIVQSDLSFSIPAGMVTALIGANGSGKSTLLRTLAGLQPPLAGSFTPLPDEYTVALVLTEALSLDTTTIHDVVAMGRYPYTSILGRLSAADERIVSEAMDLTGITELATTFYNAHSDGEKQRVLIAKALAQQTPVILLDEPTAHLDLPSRIRTFEQLSAIAHEQGKTIIISTHELDLALRYADRILLLMPEKGGAVLETPEALRQSDALRQAFGIETDPPLMMCPTREGLTPPAPSPQRRKKKKQ